MKLAKSDLQLETIVRRIEDNELDLQPDFQRGDIWNSKRRQRLVDTILREWYVPAIHIVIDSDGNELVLDGQQRLIAIRDFFRDKITIDGHIEPHNENVLELNGLTYSKLPLSVQKNVRRFILPIITLSDYKPDEPNEFFFRLNQAYNLTPPEKRNALHGKARDQVRHLVDELTEMGLLQSAAIGFSNGRLAYDDVIARTCVAIDSGTLRHHINNKVIEDFYRSAKPFRESTIQNVMDSGRLLMKMISSTNQRIKFNKGTLQTWLVYCHWAPTIFNETPLELLGDFERRRTELKQGGQNDEVARNSTMDAIVDLYDDRASYRVTDVSSVLIRDLCVHIYSQMAYKTPPIMQSDVLVSEISDRNDAIRALVSGYLNDTPWGDPIIPVGDKS